MVGRGLVSKAGLSRDFSTQLFFVAALLALLSHAGCSKSGRNSSDEVHALASGTYVGGSDKEAQQLETSVSQLEVNVLSSAQSALDSFSLSFSFNGQPAEAVVQKYLYPSGTAVLNVNRIFQIKNVEGQLDGSKATLRVTVEGSLEVETIGGTHSIVEQGTYAYFMEQTGGEWKVAGIRPLAVAYSRGEPVSHPGLLAEASINGSTVSPESEPFQIEPGQDITVETRFLGAIGERVSLSGAPLDARRHVDFALKDADTQTFVAIVKLRPELQPGHYFLEIQSEIRAGEDNGTNLLYSLPLQIGIPPDRLAAMPPRLGKEGRSSAGTAAPVNAVPPAGRKASARRATASDDSALLNEAIDFFLRLFGNDYVTDRVTMAAVIHRRFPHPDLDAYARAGYDRLLERPDSFNPNFLRFSDEKTPLSVPLCGHTPDESAMDCLIVSALWCDTIQAPDTMIKDLQAVVTASERSPNVDMLSHALLVLSELKNRECLNPAHVDALFHQTARSLERFMESTTGPYGEGVAVLLRAGLASDVRPEWVDLVRQSVQEKIDTGCSACSGEPHDLLLEMYALAQWNNLQR